MKGWGSALKPAMELITVARNPLCGTIAANVQKWGTGAVNVDGCRIPNDEPIQERGTGRIYRNGQKHSLSAWRRAEGRKDLPSNHPQMTGGHVHGRWPANLIHDGSAEVVGLFPEKAGGGFPQVRKAAKTAGIYGAFAEGHCQKGPRDMGSGSAARFFYCAKASQQERGVNNRHPTVKPIRLMRYLCRLVTPSGGKVLDPFAGTGTTGVAAASEGFDAVLVELNPEYAKLATDRCGLFCSPNATNLPRSEAE
jgi:site-specific DNA-methyltransferase (adenine-specific)